MKRIGMVAAIATVISVIGCTTMTPQQQGTVSGAAIGAAAGAGIAAISGGSGWTGAAIGAVACAATRTGRAVCGPTHLRIRAPEPQTERHRQCEQCPCVLTRHSPPKKRDAVRDSSGALVMSGYRRS